MSGPRITTGKGKSKQDYSTPPEFIAAVERRIGASIVFDLAAHAGNKKHARYFGPGGEAEDALAQPWAKVCPPGLLWLNPPFADIAPWAEKCAKEAEAGAKIALLVTASVGANWFRDHVAPHAYVCLLNGRLSFVVGDPPFTKDCMVCFYGVGSGIEVWHWKSGVVHKRWAG